MPHGGLSAARNVGLAEASGEIVAYTDADVRVDHDWLTYLVQPLLTQDVAGAGGPNVVPHDDPWVAQCVARAPGGPTHVMLDDRIAEHVPGCNMAFRRDALLAIGGFNPCVPARGRRRRCVLAAAGHGIADRLRAVRTGVASPSRERERVLASAGGLRRSPKPGSTLIIQRNSSRERCCGAGGSTAHCRSCARCTAGASTRAYGARRRFPRSTPRGPMRCSSSRIRRHG